MRPPRRAVLAALPALSDAASAQTTAPESIGTARMEPDGTVIRRQEIALHAKPA